MKDDLGSRIEEFKKKIKKKQPKNISRISAGSIISELLGGIIVGSLIGYWVDSNFNTLPIFLFCCSIMGTAGGIYNICKDFKKQTK